MTSVDLAAVLANEMQVPVDTPREELLDVLISSLASPDPAVRDDTAYPIFAAWVARGEFDDALAALGDRLTSLFDQSQIQARTFATLVLGWVIRRDTLVDLVGAAAIRRWRSAFDFWWAGEKDLRGYDDQLGWLHAVAHGADTVRAFALSRHSGPAEVQSLLALCTQRVLTPTDYLFAHAEDDRLAYALATVLARPQLTDAVGWLAPIAKAMDEGEPGLVPAFASNTIRTLNSLYVAVHRGVVEYDPVTRERSAAHSPASQSEVLSELADVLRRPSYWLG
jgi:Protein of unknown function (DUF2785)